MNWDIIGAAGEWAGAVAVVVTLFYLARQIRQNTKATYVSTVQSLEQGVSEVMAPWTASIENAVLFTRGTQDFTELTDEEQIFVGLLLRRLYLHMDAYYWAHESCALPTELWEREKAVLKSHVNSPGGRFVWERGTYSQSFMRFVKTELIED